MPAMRDSPIDDTFDPNDAIINRINLQLARSRSILNSWRPQNSQHEDEEDKPEQSNDDFASFGEKGGLGSKVVDNKESMLPTRRSAPKEKLLEQLIGKKAANAKRKEDAHKSMSVSKHAAPKPMTNGAKQQKLQEESDEEEEGRAAALKSKKAAKPERIDRPASDAQEDSVGEEDEDVARGGMSGRKACEAENPETSSAQAEAKPQKRKAGGSYLDELLSQRAKKKSKKKVKG